MTDRCRLLSRAIIVVCMATLLCSSGASQEIDPHFSDEQLAFFESKIRPLLIERCGECHSDKAETIEAGLRLDSRRAMLTGGDTGPAIVPGTPEKSLLIESIHYGGTYEMPPDSKLPVEDIELL